MSKKFFNLFSKKTVVYLILYLLVGFIILSTFLFTNKTDHNFPLLKSILVFFASVLLVKYSVYMCLSPWYDLLVYLKYNKSDKKIINYNPKVSVIIPAWNERIGIISTIKSLLESNYKNTELVVINDGSTDDSDRIIRKFIEKYNKESYAKNKIKIVYHYQKNGGKGKALNKGIKLSTGEIIVSTDADCIVLKDTIKNFVKYFSNPKVMAAVGNVKMGNTTKLIGVIQHLEFLFSFYFKKADSLMNTIYIIGGAAGAFRREIFDTIGLYNTKNITEDIDLSVRIQEAGMKIVYASDAIVYTEGANDVQGLMKQRLRWKRGRFETFYNKKHLFFSNKKNHNKILTNLILPSAIFGDVQLSLEIFFLIFLFIFSFMTSDFSSFISGIIVVSSMFFVQIFFDDKNTRKNSFYFLIPIGWMLFYLTTFVECNALFKSIKGVLQKKEIKWQQWKRTGVF